MSAGGKRRVLFIGPYPPPYSGPELSMKLFLDSELKDHYELRFLRTNFRASNVNKARLDASMVRAFFRFMSRLLVELLFHRPALVYYPVTPTQIGWLGRDAWCLLACRLFRVKSVIHLRGSHFKLNLSMFYPQIKRLVRLACKDVSLALVQADCLRDQFQGLVSRERIAVLTQAIDTAEFRNPDPADYDPMRILFMGHLTKAKGYCDLLRAIPLVADEFPEVRFMVAGNMREGERGVFFNQATGERIDYEDPFEAEQEILAGPYAKNYENRGIITGDEKLETIRRINFFVLPSYSEGFSRSLLEAMCLGKPVVCTPVGAHKEAVRHGEHGLVFDPGDVDGLAESMKKLLQDKLMRDKIGTRNYEDVRSTYDIRVVADDMHHLLDGVMDSHAK